MILVYSGFHEYGRGRSEVTILVSYVYFTLDFVNVNVFCFFEKSVRVPPWSRKIAIFHGPPADENTRKKN
jgi:hypothetical protein